MEIQIIDNQGNAVGVKALPDGVLNADPHDSLLHQTVRYQRSRKRAGTHSVLTRGEMKGGGKKPWKQKGTGRARAGSSVSPLWVGGGVAHGPKPRSYAFSMNKKERRQAILSALRTKVSDGSMLVVSGFGLEAISTKQAVGVIAKFGIAEGAKVLVVISGQDSVVEKSLRNIPTVRCLAAEGLNVYDVLNHKYLLVVESAFGQVLARAGVSQDSV